jgi:hypothetical protein
MPSSACRPPLADQASVTSIVKVTATAAPSGHCGIGREIQCQVYTSAGVLIHALNPNRDRSGRSD